MVSPFGNVYEQPPNPLFADWSNVPTYDPLVQFGSEFRGLDEAGG